jgi:AraC-like DNA-binding protein
MHVEIGSLNKYPYVSYNDYNAKTIKLESDTSTDLIWNSTESLKCVMNNHEMVIPSNSIVLLDKGSSLSCRSNNLSQVRTFRLNAEIFSNSLVFICGFINTSAKMDFNNNVILSFDDDQSYLIENMFVNLKKVLEKKSSIDIEKLRAIICNLLQGALKERFAHDVGSVNRFGEILNSHFNIFHNVSDYALQLRMKPKNLLRLFQKQGLKNPSEIIKEKLLLEIKEMIIYTDKSIKEVCFEVGFYDPAYFSRFFKKHVGVTAKYFREQYAYNSNYVKMENSAIQ